MEVEAMEDSMRWGFSYTDVLPSISDARVWAHGQCLGVVRQVEVEPEPGELAYPPFDDLCHRSGGSALASPGDDAAGYFHHPAGLRRIEHN